MLNRSTRRDFLRLMSAALPATLAGSPLSRAYASGQSKVGRELAADLVVIGGGLGGCAAALAALRLGRSVILTEPTDWIGGQLTSQAVPPDEHPWIESFGCTASYRALRNGIRDYYRRNYPLTAEARRNPKLDPGNGNVSALCHEPRVALAVLYEMLAPYLSNGRLMILLDNEPIAATTTGDRLDSVTLCHLPTSENRTLLAPWFIDATETGELLPLAKVEYVTGAESQKQTGEMHAKPEPQPANMQAVTWCFPLEYVPGGNFVGDKPANYEFWRDYVPPLNPPWTGKLLDWTATQPKTLKRRELPFDPTSDVSGWWTYRRIIDPRNFEPGSYAGGTTLVNWPQNDYFLGNVFEVSEEEAKKHLQGARELSLALLYWIQTDAPRPDGGTGWPGVHLRPELVGTTDGLAKAVYIRESRRILAEFTVTEEHVGADARCKLTGKSRNEVTAEPFADSVGIGSYSIDLHPSTAMDNYIDVGSLPFRIPMGALIPRRVENLLAGCKNIGTTHITNGCYRLHPVEWNIGESAGLLAAHCLQTQQLPRAVRKDVKRRQEFQRLCKDQGIELEWPKVGPRG